MPVAAPCGSCPDCQERTRKALDRFCEQRDPLVSYGIPPKLNPEFQRTGRGQMFLPPHRTKPEGIPHFPRHLDEKEGVEFPTLPITDKQLRRHIKLYGSECTRGVKTVSESAARRAKVKNLLREGLPAAEVARLAKVSVRTVERQAGQ